VRGLTLAAAKASIDRANCRTGKISRVYSGKKAGRVISQAPAPGGHLDAGASVRLVLSRGPKPKPHRP
jgi:beta-lactam-binding protein with PASTA domain